MPLVIHFLFPSTTKWSPASRAVHARLETSLPAPGSVMQRQMIFSPARHSRTTRSCNARFPGIPKLSTGGMPIPSPPIIAHAMPPPHRDPSSTLMSSWK